MLRLSRILGLIASMAHVTNVLAADHELPLTKIAFGSCIKQDKPQPIWDAIHESKPELFILLGDNIYGDSTDMNVLRTKYGLLNSQPGFLKLKRTCPVIGTWDDHDYGANDAGADYPKRRESQQVFLDFFEVPANDPRRSQEGVFSANVYGPRGKRVQVILLDTRYFRSPLERGFTPGEPGEGYRGPYASSTDPGTTVLGEPQWRWLEEQLKIPADLRVIGSSIQLIANDHGFERWGTFPHERSRFLNLLKRIKANGVVVISGDRHLAEISQIRSTDVDSTGVPLIDVTSSSLNAPSGNVTKSGVRFMNEINSHRVGLQYFDANFGTILIDWDQPDPFVRLQVRDEKGGVVLQHRVKLKELRP